MYNNIKFSKGFDIEKRDIISFTGGGGKTSLIFKIAEELSQNAKVLIATTTKIYTPVEEQYETLIINSEESEGCNETYLKGKNRNIDILGSFIDKENGKLVGVSQKVLKNYLGKYDYILIESDGSARKPLKAWNESEPVTPEYATKIIGITNLDALGTFIKDSVHRKELFCEKFNKNENDIVTLELIEEYLLKNEFFKIASLEKCNINYNAISNSKIKKYIFINGVETLERINQCLYLGNTFAQNQELCNTVGNTVKITFGSILKDELYIYEKVNAISLLSGFSRRMGKDKLLILYEGKYLMEHLLKKLTNIHFYQKVLVTTPDKIKVLEDKKYSDFIKIKNEEPQNGQSYSIKLGVESLNNSKLSNQDKKKYMFFTGDQPFLKEETILNLIKESLKVENFEKVVIPYIENNSFSPVIFPDKYKESLLIIKGDKGGKSVIKLEEDIAKLNCTDLYEFIDIDTQEDLKYLEK
ncbi:MAG: selenium cofactor biosynthesis protein YqeC [Fusobacteriaceae bacterium]